MGDKKPDVGLEHLLDRETMPLMRLVERAEHRVEFSDQLPCLWCRPGYQLDHDIEARHR
jgi:hypothetical protein